MVWRILLIVFVLTAGIALVVQHAVMGSDIRTIAELHSDDLSDGTVSVRGVITYANENRFALKDETGTAELVTCPVWYKRVSLFPGDEVTVLVQVMKAQRTGHKSDLTLSVYKITRNGEEIEIRDKPGKPPWTSTFH